MSSEEQRENMVVDQCKIEKRRCKLLPGMYVYISLPVSCLSPSNSVVRKASECVEVYRLKKFAVRMTMRMSTLFNTHVFMYMNMNCHESLMFFHDRKNRTKAKRKLTTSFLSWICKPFRRRIQRSVPSGFSYSQKPKAKEANMVNDQFQWFEFFTL